MSLNLSNAPANAVEVTTAVLLESKCAGFDVAIRKELIKI